MTMPGNRTTHTYQLVSAGLLIAVFMVMLVSPASAEIIVDTELSEWVDTTVSGVQKETSGMPRDVVYGGIQFADISRDRSLSYIVFEISGNHGIWKDTEESIPNGRHDFEYDFNGKTRPGVLYMARSTNLLGQVTSTKFTIFLNDWNIGTLTGAQYVDLPFYIYRGRAYTGGVLPPNAYALSPGQCPYPYLPITVTEVSGIPWKNQIKISELNNGYEIILNREVDNQPFK